jgi:hypothetical protein
MQSRSDRRRAMAVSRLKKGAMIAIAMR